MNPILFFAYVKRIKIAGFRQKNPKLLGFEATVPITDIAKQWSDLTGA